MDKNRATAARGPNRAVLEQRRQLGGVLDFMQTLWALDHQLDSASKRMSARLGLTGPQRLVVRIIGRFPGISAGELADVLHSDPSTLTGVLRRLELRGLIRRSQDDVDRRRALFELTVRGRAVDRLKAGTVEASIRRVLQRVPARAVDAAIRLLDAVADGLSDNGAPAGRGRRPGPR